MRKILISIIGALVFCTAFATGENIPTSKSYVDSVVAEKQDKIAANDGAAQVLTNTGTAGEYGTKGIYNSTGEYATQSDALIDAVTMNTAVQNAIDSEFQCVEWANPNDHTSDCLLMDVFGTTGHSSSKNLLNESFMNFDTYGPNTAYGYTRNDSRILPTENGKTYTLSAKLTQTNGGRGYYYYIAEVFPDGHVGYPTGGQWMWACDITRNDCQRNNIQVKFTFTTRDNAVYMVYIAGSRSWLNGFSLSEYQMEEGSTATTYEQYSNLYIPSAQ